MKRKERELTKLLVAPLLLLSFGGFAQESSTFVMDRVSVSVGAARATSTSFDASITISQESPVGGASFCNTGFVNSIGFWSILGDLPTPILLQMALNETNATDLDLSWTGSADTFEIYRDFSPVAVVAPGNLYLEATDCSTIESDALASDVIFYRIVPKP